MNDTLINFIAILLTDIIFTIAYYFIIIKNFKYNKKTVLWFFFGMSSLSYIGHQLPSVIAVLLRTLAVLSGYMFAKYFKKNLYT